MHVIVVVAVILVVLLLGWSMEQRMFQGNPQRKEQFRQRMYARSWRAAGVALALAIVAVIWLRNGGTALSARRPDCAVQSAGRM